MLLFVAVTAVATAAATAAAAVGVWLIAVFGFVFGGSEKPPPPSSAVDAPLHVQAAEKCAMLLIAASQRVHAAANAPDASVDGVVAVLDAELARMQEKARCEMQLAVPSTAVAAAAAAAAAAATATAAAEAEAAAAATRRVATEAERRALVATLPAKLAAINAVGPSHKHLLFPAQLEHL